MEEPRRRAEPQVLTRASLLATIASMPLSNRLYLIAAALLVTGCASTGGRVRRVALLPVDGIGLADAQNRRMRTAIADRLAASDEGELKLLPREQVDREVATLCGDGASPEPQACAERVGRRLGASHVVMATIAGVGNTYVLQARLFAVQRGTVTRTLEETVFGDEATRRAAVADVASRLVGGDRRPWYSRWWIWALAAAAVAAGVIAPVVAVTADPYTDVQLP